MGTECFDALIVEKEEAGPVLLRKTLTDADLPNGDVRVRVTHAGLNYKDALAVTGKGKVLRSYPMVPGIDLAGVVEASRADRFREGDHVFATGQGIGETRWGGYAGKASLPAEWLRRVPDGRTCAEMALMGTAAFTAMLSVVALESRGLTPGSGPVLVTGAGGGVGGFAVLLLAAAGYDVTACTGRTELHGYLRTLGAAGILDRSDLLREARPLEPETWAGVLDSVGGKILSSALSATKVGGVVTACGLASGPGLETTVFPFIIRGVSLLGIDSVRCPPGAREVAWSQLAERITSKHLAVIRSETVSLQEVPEASERLLAGGVRGRILVAI